MLDNASSGLYVEKHSKQNNDNSWKFTLLDNIKAFIWSSGENWIHFMKITLLEAADGSHRVTCFW